MIHPIPRNFNRSILKPGETVEAYFCGREDVWGLVNVFCISGHSTAGPSVPKEIGADLHALWYQMLLLGSPAITSGQSSR
jgi:hypothetical protein